MFSSGPPGPGLHNHLRRLEQEMGADETRRQRRFEAERLHASYDDPPRKRQWPVWQFWRRAGRRLWRGNVQDDPVPVMRASRGERARDWLRRLVTVGIIGGTTFLLEQ